MIKGKYLLLSSLALLTLTGCTADTDNTNGYGQNVQIRELNKYEMDTYVYPFKTTSEVELLSFKKEFKADFGNKNNYSITIVYNSSNADKVALIEQTIKEMSFASQKVILKKESNNAIYPLYVLVKTFEIKKQPCISGTIEDASNRGFSEMNVSCEYDHNMRLILDN